MIFLSYNEASEHLSSEEFEDLTTDPSLDNDKVWDFNEVREFSFRDYSEARECSLIKGVNAVMNLYKKVKM